MKKLWKVSFIFLFFLSLILNFNTYLPVSLNDTDIKFPILMYHKISTRQNSWGKYSISPYELEADIKLILARGFTPITISDLIAFNKGIASLPEKPIMLTFDDGNRSDYLYAYPLAQKYNIKIVCSPVGAYTESNDNVYLSWDEMTEMEKSGLVEFQNHSYNLHNFNNTRKGSLKSSSETESAYELLISEDLARSQALFKEHRIKTPTCFTYPFGMRDDLLLDYVKQAGFSATLGTYAQINILSDDLYDLRRFNRPHNYNIGKILDLVE